MQLCVLPCLLLVECHSFSSSSFFLFLTLKVQTVADSREHLIQECVSSKCLESLTYLWFHTENVPVLLTHPIYFIIWTKRDWKHYRRYLKFMKVSVAANCTSWEYTAGKVNIEHNISFLSKVWRCYWNVISHQMLATIHTFKEIKS